MHMNALLNSDQQPSAKRASSAIPKLNLSDIHQAPKKPRKSTNLHMGNKGISRKLDRVLMINQTTTAGYNNNNNYQQHNKDRSSS